MSDVSRPAVEWPTLAVAVAIYAGYALLTLNYHNLPWWLVLPAGGLLLAWHGSLQHEAVHGQQRPVAPPRFPHVELEGVGLLPTADSTGRCNTLLSRY